MRSSQKNSSQEVCQATSNTAKSGVPCPVIVMGFLLGGRAQRSFPKNNNSSQECGTIEQQGSRRAAGAAPSTMSSSCAGLQQNLCATTDTPNSQKSKRQYMLSPSHSPQKRCMHTGGVAHSSSNSNTTQHNKLPGWVWGRLGGKQGGRVPQCTAAGVQKCAGLSVCAKSQLQQQAVPQGVGHTTARVQRSERTRT